MPYFDGFYNANGEYVCVAYPGSPNLNFTVNTIGLPQELMGLEGHVVTIWMKRKGGCLDVDYAKAFSDYLLSHGMSQQQPDALVDALTKE